MNHPVRKLVAAGAAVLILIPGAAWADNVVNDVVSVGEIVNLQVGQSADVTLRLQATGAGNDGIAGCNLQGAGASLTLGVVSSTSGVATAPSSVQFTACTPNAGSAQLVHVTATGVGTTTLTFPYSSSVSTANESTSSFSTTQASFTVVVEEPAPPADTEDPVVTITKPAGENGAGWYKTDPVSVAVSASDNVGVTSFTCSLDNGTSVAKNPAGDTVSVTGDGTHTVACSATDAAGNDGSDSKTVRIDTELPTIEHTLTPSAPNDLGWFNQSVVVDFTCDDKVSLIATCEGDTTLGEGENQTVTGKATDNAGNEKTDPVTNIDVDLTKPDLNITGLDSGTYDICATPTISKPTFGPTDNLSGIQSQSDSWTTPTTATGVGSYVYTATAKDNADNEANGGRTYTLNYGAAAFSGPLQPINTDGTSRFKVGSTVPVKFRLACNGVAISEADASLTVKKYDGSADPGVDEAISTSAATTGNKFRWSSTDQQYIFNLGTKAGYTNPGSSTPISFTAGTWTLTINLDDGTKRSFNLNLVK